MTEPLNLQSRLGIYSVALFIIAMPAVILSLTRVFIGNEPLVLSNIDLFWTLACLASGLLLLIRFKIAWTIALIQIFLVAVLNITQLLASIQADTASPQYNYQALFSVASLAAILMIAAYFRYPYLDRRDTTFLGIAHRYDVSIPATLNEDILGKVINASMSGVIFRLAEKRSFKTDHVYNISIPDLNIQDEVVSVVGMDGKDVTLKFSSLSLGQMFKLKSLLKSK